MGDVNAGDVYDIFVNNTFYISNVASLQEDKTVFVYENGRYAILYTYHGEDEEYDFYYIDESGNPVCECALRISNYNDKDGGEYSVFYDESTGYESITPQEAADILNGYGEKRLFEFTPFSSVMGEDYAK